MYPYKFEYYRFQLVPKKVVQLSIDNVAYTYDEIKAKKNEYFSEVLTKTTFKGKKGNLPYRIVYEKNNIFVLFLLNSATLLKVSERCAPKPPRMRFF